MSLLEDKGFFPEVVFVLIKKNIDKGPGYRYAISNDEHLYKLTPFVCLLPIGKNWFHNFTNGLRSYLYIGNRRSGKGKWIFSPEKEQGRMTFTEYRP